MSKFKDLKKIYVIGTGLSSLISILFLVSKGIKPIVIDIGTKYKESDYTPPIFKPYFYKRKIEEVSFFGGLSNVWKGVVKFATKKEFKELNISNPEELMREILDYTNNLYFFSNVEIDKNKFELQRISNENIVIDKLLQQFDEIHQPVIMSSQEKYCEPYNTTRLINDLIESNKITFIQGKVLSIKSEKDYKLIEYVSNDNKYLEKYGYIFCGAGVISSTQIIKKSLKMHLEPEIKCNQKWLIFSIYKKKKKTNNTFPLFQGTITKNDKTNIYIQSNLLSQLLKSKFHGWLKSIFEIVLKLPIFNYISIVYVSTMNEEKSKNNIHNLYYYFKDLITLSKKINSFQNLFKVFPIGIKLPKLGGGHFGSTFPSINEENLSLDLEKEIYSNDHGSIKGLEKFSVIDMTSISKIHAVPPTLNLMLHSLNITKKVYNKIIN